MTRFNLPALGAPPKAAPPKPRYEWKRETDNLHVYIDPTKPNGWRQVGSVVGGSFTPPKTPWGAFTEKPLGGGSIAFITCGFFATLAEAIAAVEKEVASW